MKAPAKSPSKCVICGKPQTEKYKPFCSEHCANVDLNRWFSGRYAIPVEEDDERPDTEDQS